MEEKESFEALVARIRTEFTDALERHAFHAFAKKVRERTPVRINGPIESDILDSILGFGGLGLPNYGPGSDAYRAIWKALEDGV